MNLKAMIHTGFRESKQLLKNADIRFSENNAKYRDFSMSKYSREFIEASQTDDYNKIYQTARKNFDFDILLDDQSIFQFSYKENIEEQIVKIRYAYYEPPIDVISYSEFLENLGLDIKICGDIFTEEYEQYKSESKLKMSVTPIRYDYDMELFKELEHPVSHIHIGHQNEIRLPVSVIMSPKAFVAFVIRQVYRGKWVSCISNEFFYEIYKNCKNACTILDQMYFTEKEKRDFYIT